LCPSATDPEALDVLAFGPHPDDAELCAGGTLLRLADAGWRVGLVDLTRGEMATRGTPETRAREAEEARRLLGARLRANLGFPDLGVSATDAGQLGGVVAALRRHRPALVLACSERDRHPDHIEAGRLVERACYVAGLSAFAAPGAPFRPDRLLFYMGRVVFEPRLVVDVSAVYERKVAVMAAYRSQLFRDPDDPRVTPLSEPDVFDDFAARARHFGNRIGVDYGEPFDAREPFGLRDVGALLDGRPSERGGA
jgi:bacillithiol biosynthesis deacetylase BshB1